MGSRSSGSSGRTVLAVVPLSPFRSSSSSLSPAAAVVAGSGGRRRQRQGSRGGSSGSADKPFGFKRQHHQNVDFHQNFATVSRNTASETRLPQLPQPPRSPRPPRPRRLVTATTAAMAACLATSRLAVRRATKPSWRTHHLLRRDHRDHQHDQLGRHAENPRVSRVLMCSGACP